MSAVISVLALILSTVLTRYLCSPQSRFGVLDHPNERSLHSRAMPRGGGLAILAASYVSLALLALLALLQGLPAALIWIAGSTALVAVISYWDDRSGLPAGLRLAAHVIAAGLLVVGGVQLAHVVLPGFSLPMSEPLLVVVAVLFTVWMTNLYNFMDGMDGFAGGMAVIGFATFALFGWRAGHESFATVSLILAAASAGFLVFNFPPARIFMGDVGSSTLGFLVAALSVWGARDGVFPHWVAVLVFSPFVVDATVTLFRRLIRGERVWEAHRSHYYQRLVRLGWGHRKTVLWEYVLMLACAVSALWAVTLSVAGQWALILAWTTVYTVLAVLVSRLEQRSTADAPGSGP
jgi:UDP-N-acetylmuramyl pentapeptide phosphotransferase/UDP-N-acetylglucosamine-1-phosphate transferase